jgi:hypothetical protein
MDMNKVKLFLHVQQSHDGQGVTIGVVFKQIHTQQQFCCKTIVSPVFATRLLSRLLSSGEGFTTEDI